MTEQELARRNERALKYLEDVRRRRRWRATYILTAIEVVMLAYSIVLAVAIYKGGGPL